MFDAGGASSCLILVAPSDPSYPPSSALISGGRPTLTERWLRLGFESVRDQRTRPEGPRTRRVLSASSCGPFHSCRSGTAQRPAPGAWESGALLGTPPGQRESRWGYSAAGASDKLAHTICGLMFALDEVITPLTVYDMASQRSGATSVMPSSMAVFTVACPALIW